jgi:hypothetical protein
VSSTRRRTLRRLATSGVAASLLIGAAATSAEAATYPTITTTTAKTAIPAAKLVPGSVHLLVPIEAAAKTYTIACLAVQTKLALPGGEGINAVYVSKTTSALDPSYIQWNVSIAVFPSPAKAAAAQAKLVKAEKACPKKKNTKFDGIPATVTRTLATSYKVGSFSGYRSIEHVSAAAGSQSVDLRAYETNLVRGNVIVFVDELAPSTATNGKLQDTRRKAVTALMVKRLSALK